MFNSPKKEERCLNSILTMWRPVWSELLVDVVVKPGHKGEHCDGNGCRDSEHPDWSSSRVATQEKPSSRQHETRKFSALLQVEDLWDCLSVESPSHHGNNRAGNQHVEISHAPPGQSLCQVGGQTDACAKDRRDTVSNHPHPRVRIINLDIRCEGEE